MNARGRTLVVGVCALAALAGCSSGGDSTEPARATGIDPAWFDALHEQVDARVEDQGTLGEMPILSAGECPIEVPTIAGETIKDTPDVGVSTLGDSGHRLICAWSPPYTELILTQYADPAELELSRDEVSQVGVVDNGANVETTEKITVGERDFYVMQTVFPTNGTHIDYAVWYLDDEQSGMVLLTVEASDERNLIETYDAQQAAEDLSDLLS